MLSYLYMKRTFFYLLHSKYKFLLGLLIGSLIFLCLLPLCFFGLYAYPFGWLFGLLIASFASYLQEISASFILKNKKVILSVLLFSVRFLLYAFGLIISALLTFYYRLEGLNFFMVMGAYIFINIMFIVVTSVSKEDLNYVR